MRGIFKRITNENKFSRKYACWCLNHNGISKLKKDNRRQARVKLKRQLQRETSSLE